MADTQPKDPKNPMGVTRGTVLAIVALCAAFVVGGYGVLYLLGVGFGPKQSATAPVVSIGGPFTLVNQNGKTVTDKDFRGKMMLVFFGYTYCPDVCPTSLTQIAQTLDILGKDGEKIVPVFITVDPERDRPEYLKDYVQHFHPRLVALTGTTEQIKAVAKEYRVYFSKVREKGGGEDDYLMDHTAIVYLMGPDGKFLTHISHGTDPDAMAKRIRKYL